MDRAEFKKRVRALLISSKQGCTPNGLLKDYRSVFGEGLPLYEFGYRSVVAMAEDMPDVVRIQQGGGCGVILRGVADESTRHIAKMVSRQRNTGFHQIKSDQPVRRAVTTPSIPFHIQGCLRQLMHAYPNGLPIEQFEEAYARRFGYYLSLRRLKCNSLQELINNVPDVLKIDKDAAGRTVVVEASKMFISVEGDKSRPTRLLNQSRILEGQTIMKISDQLSSYDDASPTNEDQVKVQDSQPTIDYLNTNGSASPSVPVPTNVKENILKLLHSKHLGIWCTSLHEEYKNVFGCDLELGPFRNIMDLLSNMKDVCVLEKPNINSGDWLVRSRGQPPEAVTTEDTTGSVEGDVKPPGSLKELVGKLMLDYPAGIQLQELPILFKQKYKFELQVEKLGFNSIASLVNSISDVVKKVIQNGQLLIIPVTKSGTSAVAWNNTNGTMESDNALNAGEAVETDGAPIHKKTSPKKTVFSSVSVEPVMSSEYSPVVLPQSTNTINVTISHAINPGKFFIQLIGKEHSHLLNTLMMTISKFYYSVTGVEKAIARPVLGQACCALFDGDGCWYRAEIIGIPTPFTVLVKYVDYGNVCELPIGSVRKSQPEFLMLPAQSVECCLANIKPKERVWSDEACKVFQETVNEKPLVAFIQQSIMGHPLHITLCDTSTKEDVYIHELLIGRGLACAVEREQAAAAATPTSSDAFMLSQFKEQFYTLQQTLLLQQQMLQQQLMVNGQQLRQNGQINGNEAESSWKPQGQSVPSSQGSQRPIPVVTNTNSEHRKKMAAAKDIWSSDSEAEDEKSELNGTENMTKQLETKLERLNEERRNILERMTYNSSSGSISSWVEKLQNIEGTIKATQENLKRRANGLPPLPPPGLSHMQPAKQVENHSANATKPKGVTAASKPIIGLGRGKRFTKPTSLPTTPVSSVPVGETPSFPVFGNSNESQPEKSRLWSDSDIFGHDQSKKQQVTSRSEVFDNSQLTSSNEIFGQDQSTSQQHADSSASNLSHLQFLSSSGSNQDQPKQQQISSSSVVYSENHLQPLVSSSENLNDQDKKQPVASGNEMFGKSKLHQLSVNSEIFVPMAKRQQQHQASNNEVYKVSSGSESLNHDQSKKQHQMASSSSDKNQVQSSSSSEITHKLPSNQSKEPPREHLTGASPKQITRNDEKMSNNQPRTTSTTPVSDKIMKSFSKLTLVNTTPFTSSSTTTSSSTVTQASIPVVSSSRVMSYSSAVTSQPPRRAPPIRPQQPFNRMPMMYQPPPPPLIPLQPHMYGHNQPPMVGLGRGVDPWLAGPPPKSRGANGHYMHKMPPPVNFDHHSFYEIPSSGLHNPFYPIPPMGSSSGLDII